MTYLKRFDGPSEVRAIARERIGAVPSRKIMTPKTKRPDKYKKKRFEEN